MRVSTSNLANVWSQNKQLTCQPSYVYNLLNLVNMTPRLRPSDGDQLRIVPVSTNKHLLNVSCLWGLFPVSR